MRFRAIEGGLAEFKCIGCNKLHQVKISGLGSLGFNNNLEYPTLSEPVYIEYATKVLTTDYERFMTGAIDKIERFVCHSYITVGSISYMKNCTHDRANTIMRLPHLEEAENA